jgi:hypothetical protein
MKKKILVMDKDKEVLDIISYILNEKGRSYCGKKFGVMKET